MSYNESGYNEAAYNQEGAAPSSAVAPTSLLTFDGFNCNDGTNMIIETLKFNSGHRRDIDQFSIPRADGVRVANLYEREKIITAIGIVKAATVNDLETYIDTIKKNLRGQSKQLVTVWGGQTRLYERATLMNGDSIFDREYYHINMMPFRLEFLCEDLSTDWAYEIWTMEITSAVDTLITSGDGTSEGKPVIVCVFSAASGVTSLTCAIDENAQSIGYSGAIAAGDVFIFDAELQTVTKNGVDVDFTGYFPEMTLGTNTFRFTTNGSSRTNRVTVKSKHAYL